MTLQTFQFDALDHLTTLNADTRTISREDLATTYHGSAHQTGRNNT